MNNTHDWFDVIYSNPDKSLSDFANAGLSEKNIDLKKKTKKTLFFWRFIMTVAVAFYTAAIKHKGRKINCKGLNGLI